MTNLQTEDKNISELGAGVKDALRAFQMTPGDTQKNSAFLRGAHDLPSMINSWHRGCATGNGTER